MPSASAMAFMVEAVPMVLQWPADGAEAATISMNCACQMAVPEPKRLPSLP